MTAARLTGDEQRSAGCPACGAEPGSHCTTSGGKQRDPHRERWATARDQLRIETLDDLSEDVLVELGDWVPLRGAASLYGGEARPTEAFAIPSAGALLVESFGGGSPVVIPRHVIEAALRELGERS